MNFYRIAALLAFASSSLADPPVLINYQGRLVDGTNVVNGTVRLSLRLFTNATPVGGEVRFYEDSNAVTVVDGVYSTFLGDNTTSGSLVPALTNDNLYLEVMVNGTALSPRERLASVPYALKALTVPNDAITAAMIATGAIGSNELANGSVNSNALAAASVGAADLATNAVRTGNILDAQITSAKMNYSLSSIFFQSVTNPFPNAGDNFGWAVCASGDDRFAVGAPNDDTFGSNAGLVYLYNADRSLQAIVTNDAPAADDQFGFALSEFGSSGLFGAGAPGRDAGAIQAAGSVYIHFSSGGINTEIVNPTPASNDRFGSSLGKFGSDILIGAPLDDQGAVDAGMAYRYTSSGFLHEAFTNPVPATGDQFGQALCRIGSDRVAIGAPGDDTGATNAGVVYVFNTSTDSLVMTITNPAPSAGDLFGFALASVGSNRFVVGAPATNTTNFAQAYLYNSDGVLLASRNYGTNAGGFSVATFGPDFIVIGEPLDDSGTETNRGSVDFQTTHLGTLSVSTSSTATDTNDQFGFSVCSFGMRGIVVGAPFSNEGASDAGEVFIEEADYYVAGLVAESVANDSIGLDELDLTVVDNRYVNETGDSISGTHSVTGEAATVRISRNNSLVAENSAAALVIEDTTNVFAQLLGPTNATLGILFGMPLDELDASIRYNNNDDRELAFRVGGNSTRMTITTNGFVGIATTAPTSTLHVAGTITCTTLNETSDRNAKENFAPVDPEAILDRVAGLPVQYWTYRGQEHRHIGPTAQDFHDAFNVGENDVTISGVDRDGVSLAAIQALYRLVQDQQRRIEELEEALQRQPAPAP
jgi:hypothetical protein